MIKILILDNDDVEIGSNDEKIILNNSKRQIGVEFVSADIVLLETPDKTSYRVIKHRDSVVNGLVKKGEEHTLWTF